MNTRLFAGAVSALLMMPAAAAAQSLAGSDPHPDVHLYAASEFGIDPQEVTFTALLTSKWVEVQVGATRSYAIWAVTA